ncbi:MAG: four helix bundle protein [Candidatus Peribacteraceae bacterium]|jgi:four helix bundle protein|nr:four helix bundle protein [Candidatus Peribacteraceae bacterium]
MKKRHYEQLIVWQEAHKLCLRVYELVDRFPSKERFGLCSQMRRSASSVPTNIVEGNVKRSAREKLHFIEHAESSLEELDYQLFLSRDLGYITSEEFESLRGDINRVSYLLTKFRAGIV